MLPTDPDNTLSELALLIQEGRLDQPPVLAALVRRFAQSLHRLAGELLAGRAASDEILRALVEQTFLDARARQDGFERFDTVIGWLFALLYARIKPLQRQPAGLQEFGSPLLAALFTLPDKLRTPIYLRCSHQLTIPEIAEVLGLRDGDVQNRLAAARRRAAPEIGKAHKEREMHAILDGLLETDDDFDEHLQNCEDCRRDWGDWQASDRRLKTALQLPDAPGAERSLGDAEIEGIVARLETGEVSLMEREPRRGLREIGWVGAAIIGVLSLFWWLNPIWTATPASPAQPQTPLPTPATLPVPYRLPDYARLIENITQSPPPIWGAPRNLAGSFVPATGIAFSPDGQFAAFGTQDAEEGMRLIIWDFQTNRQSILDVEDAYITALAFSRTGWLASGDEEGKVVVWDAELVQRKYTLEEIPGPVYALAFSPDGYQLAVGGNRGIWVWELSDGKLVRTDHIDWEVVREVAFSPDGDYLAGADRGGSIALWDTGKFDLQLRYATNQRYITRLAFSPLSDRLASASFDGRVVVAGLDEAADGSLAGAILHTLEHPAPWVRDVAWVRGIGPVQDYLVTLASTNSPDEPGALFIWDTDTGLLASLPLTLPDAAGMIRISILPGGELLTASLYGNIQRWAPVMAAAPPDPANFLRAPTDILIPSPGGMDFPGTGDPGELRYFLPWDIATAPLELPIKYEELIPEIYTFSGGHYDADTQIASLAYRASSTTSNEALVILRIRARTAMPLRDDWIGAGATTTAFQIGGYLGEMIHGGWMTSPLDAVGGPAVYRWVDAGRVRFRWFQDGFLFEITTLAEGPSPISQFHNLIRPMANAIATVDHLPILLSHIVVEGETCAGLAGRYGTTVTHIEFANDMKSCELILVGQTLLIPISTERQPAGFDDLDCNGTPELVNFIPDDYLGEGLGLGITIDVLPAGLTPDTGRYTTAWSLTVADLPESFFVPPVMFQPPGTCRQFVAVTAFGLSEADGGMRIYSWDGEQVELVLNTEGFLVGTIGGLEEHPETFTITTQRLTYNADAGTCFRTTRVFQWENDRFILVTEFVEEGLECFGGGLQPG